MGFFDKFFKKKQNNKPLEAETFIMHPEASSLYELKKYMDEKLAFLGYISKKEYKPFMESKVKTIEFFSTLINSGLLDTYCDKNRLSSGIVRDIMARYENFEKAMDVHNEEYMLRAMLDEKLYLDNILKSVDPKINLDEDQRKVVLTDEDYCLVIAGAGAGKTTTIRILMNVFSADRGEILLDGKPIDYTKIKFGYLPEERGLYAKKKISEQLIFFAELNGLSHKDAVASVEKWLVRFGMTEYANKRLDTLSKGNQQKIQMITALAHNPQIVVLDEPFSGLDPVNAMLLKSVVKEEIAKGKIVFFSSHQMNYIEEFCDAIAILNGGQVVLAGDIYDIKRNYPRNRLVIRSTETDAILAKYQDTAKLCEDGSVLLTLASPDQKASVIQELSTLFDLDEVKVFEPTLNDIFVEYTENEI